MSNPVLQAIADRRSNRGYAPEQISEEQLQALLIAAQQSPSARDLQPWHFSVVQDRALLDEFALDYAKIMAQNSEKPDIGSGYHLFFRAPTVIFLSTAEMPVSRFAQVDCGIAAQNIALAAHALGLGSVILGRPMDVFGSPRGEYYERKMRFPEGNHFAIAIAVGRPTLSKGAHKFREGRISRV